MKILLAGHVPPHVGGKDYGGVAQHLWELANNLNENNQVEILALGRYYENTRFENGIKIHGLELNRIRWFKCMLYIPILIMRIGRVPSVKIYLLAIYSLFRFDAIREQLEDFEILHIHGWKDMLLNVEKLLGIKIPSVISMHSYHGFIKLNEIKRKKRIQFINRYLTQTDGLIHVSNADRKKGKKLGLKFKGEDRVIHNGIHTSGNAIDGERSGICFVGSLISRKRILLLLDSIPFINQDIKEVNIIGSGSQKKEVEKAIRLNSRLNYLGVVPNSEVRNILNKSTLLVVPSISESFGLAYIEALFEGTAVVGYGPTVKEFQKTMNLTTTEKKLLVSFPGKGGEAELLAKKIESTYVFRQSSEGNAAMKTLREKAIGHFGWDATIKKIENMYKKIN